MAGAARLLCHRPLSATTRGSSCGAILLALAAADNPWPLTPPDADGAAAALVAGAFGCFGFELGGHPDRQAQGQFWPGPAHLDGTSPVDCVFRASRRISPGELLLEHSDQVSRQRKFHLGS